MSWSIMDDIHESIDSCQNKVSADLFHLTVSQAQVSVDPSRSSVFLKLSADKLLVFNDPQLKFIFLEIHMKYVVFMSLWPRIIKILILN